MKILGISCSPRKEGTTVAMLEEALNAARGDGAEVELYSVAGKDINGCTACRKCVETGMCAQKDDMQELYPKMLEADGIIFGTPIYFWGMTAQAKAVMDRTFSLNFGEKGLENKVCGVVTCAGSLGLISALKDYSYYIIQKKMLPAFQVSSYAAGPDDLKSMENCLKTLNDMGRQMVALIKIGFKYPAEFVKGPGAFGTYQR